MRSDARYIKDDKVYQLQKRAWRPRRITLWLLVPLLIFLGLGVYCIFNGVGLEQDGAINYQASGEIDYKVYLKDNDYYQEKFLGMDMKYIASLINVVHADFDYNFSADDAMQMSYQYKIVAETKVTERGDASKVLYNVNEDLVSSEIESVKGGEIAIREGVDIDYPKYNQAMREFRTTFGVAADCQLILKLIVNLDGAVKEEEMMAMAIPLSEQTVDITIDTEGLEKSGQVGDAAQILYVKNTPVLITGTVIVVLSLILISVVLYYYITRFNDDPYEKELHKILKEYDTYIVEANGTVYELENVVRVTSFKELLDAQSLERTPIVFLEVEPGNKAYFIVNGVNTTYRFTLSRAYQEKMRYGEIEDEDDPLLG